MDNYFNYFTEIEEHFQRRRGTTLLLSTLDWALIETWRDAGIPLEAVLRGIDSTFDHYERRPTKTRKINSLAFCSQEVLASAEDMKEAAVGTSKSVSSEASGLTPERIAAHLAAAAAQLKKTQLPTAARSLASETARSLGELADAVAKGTGRLSLEDLERRLTVLEEKLFAVLLSATPDEAVLAVRRDADHDLAPYRRKMPAAQIEQLHRQYVHKRLLDRYQVPRLSLFYMD
ncbi:MAG: hypothetical protein L0212_10780 [Acidobacteria bacterium]|nr:hypothetical protein [Acidobacteriota bacterium]